jgi:MMP endo-(1,4)-3-O-methyl-alpha-D-mannosidase
MPDALSATASTGALLDMESTAAYIAGVQRSNGEIPWSPGGKTDPWDHVENAMALSVAGWWPQAEAAYGWLANGQLDDGSWWSHYQGGEPGEGAFKDANLSAYIAVGVLHHYLASGDQAFLREMAPAVARAMDFVTSLQGDHGAVCWAQTAEGAVDPTCLLTGCSSMYLSLGCALEIEAVLGRSRPDWALARQRLGQAIRQKPQLFDQSKARFSMDWYYPVLCGALTGSQAAERIDQGWDDFCLPGWGVRCVADRPWATVAETCELVMACAAMGRLETAREVFGWIGEMRDGDGGWWTGITCPDQEIYPVEKTTWTGAAVILAADAVHGLSPASRIFRHQADGEEKGLSA